MVVKKANTMWAITVALSGHQVDATWTVGGVFFIVPQVMLMLGSGDFGAIIKVSTRAIKIAMSWW
jgi:hypothetical protein